MHGHFGCLKGVSKSVRVLFNGIDAAIVLSDIASPAVLFWLPKYP